MKRGYNFCFSETRQTMWRSLFTSATTLPAMTSPWWTVLGQSWMMQTASGCLKGISCWILEECINFTLWVNGSSFFMGEVEEDTISIVQPHLAPVTCHLPPMPHTGKDMKPTMKTEPTIAPELATTCATVGVLVEFEGMEEDPAHAPSTEGELLLISAGYFEEIDILLNLRSHWYHPAVSLLCLHHHWSCPAWSLFHRSV